MTKPSAETTSTQGPWSPPARRRARFAACAVLAMVAATLASCGFANTSSKADSSSTLTLAVNTEQHAALAQLVPAFEKESGITVKETYTATADLNDQLRVQLSAKTAPDVLRVSPGASSAVAVGVLGKAGGLATLSGGWTSSLPSATAGLASVDKQIKAYPLSQNLLVMAYNKAVFAKLGLSVPTTWTQFLGVCAKLKAANVTPIAAGFTGGVFLQFPVYQLAATLVYSDPTIDARMRSGQVTFSNSPAWRSVFEKLLLLQQRGYLTPGANGVSSDQAVASVAAAKAGMISTVSTQLPTGDVGVFALPATDDAARTRVPVAPDFLGVNAAAKNPDGAQKLIAFLSRPENVAAYAKAAKALPAVTGSLSTSVEVLAPITPYLARQRTAAFANYQWPNADTQQRLLQSGQQLISGEIDVEELLRQLSTEYAKGGR